MDPHPARFARHPPHKGRVRSSAPLRLFQLTNRDINRLALHWAVGNLASALSYVFSAVFFIRAGLTPAQVFLAFAAILALRFLMRPMVLLLAPAIGLKRALILSAVLCAIASPVLAFVHGIGLALAAFVAIAAAGQVFYCTCYITALGDTDHRGSQVGAVQALGAIANVFGPALGGLLLTAFGPLPTFGAAFLIMLAGILPLLTVAEPPLMRGAPPRAYAAAHRGMWLYFADGFIQVSLTTAWSLLIFSSLGER
jgi:MFS transporter, DHA1 family, inner membrane transport protein